MEIESSNVEKLELTPAQQALIDNLREHTEAELVHFDPVATLATMAANPFIFLAPIVGGGEGPEGVRKFYEVVLTHLPKDFDRDTLTVTVGSNRGVIEQGLSFTHDIPMEWMLPGIAPTGKHVEIPLVVICTFEDGKLESERAYWDQASMLTQLGLLDPGRLPITRTESARKLRELANRPK